MPVEQSLAVNCCAVFNVYNIVTAEEVKKKCIKTMQRWYQPKTIIIIIVTTIIYDFFVILCNQREKKTYFCSAIHRLILVMTSWLS